MRGIVHKATDGRVDLVRAVGVAEDGAVARHLGHRLDTHRNDGAAEPLGLPAKPVH